MGRPDSLSDPRRHCHPAGCPVLAASARASLSARSGRCRQYDSTARRWVAGIRGCRSACDRTHAGKDAERRFSRRTQRPLVLLVSPSRHPEAAISVPCHRGYSDNARTRGTGVSDLTGSPACPYPSACRRRPIVRPPSHEDRAIAVSAVNRSIGWDGTGISGATTDRTGMPPGTPPALSPGSFGLRRAEHLRTLKLRQNRTCATTGRRLLRSAEVDHRAPLFAVWSAHRSRAWPELLGYWGAPNLQVINKPAHQEKCAEEAAQRSRRRVYCGKSSCERSWIPPFRLSLIPGVSRNH